MDTIIKKIVYNAEEALSTLVYSNTDLELQRSLNSVIDEVKKIANPDQLYYLVIDKLDDDIKVSIGESPQLQKAIQEYCGIFSKHAQKCLKETLKNYEFLELHHLPSKMLIGEDINLDAEVEQEMAMEMDVKAEIEMNIEQEVQTKVIVEQEVESSVKAGKSIFYRHRIFRTLTGLFRKVALSQMEFDRYKLINSLPDSFVSLSNNLTQVFAEELNAQFPERNLKSFVENKKRIIPKYMVSIKVHYTNPKSGATRLEAKSILLDRLDYEDLKTAIHENKEDLESHPMSIRVYNLSANDKEAIETIDFNSISKNDELEVLFESLHDNDLKDIVHAKIYRGASQLSTKEFKVFLDWIENLTPEEQAKVADKYFNYFWNGRSIQGNVYQKLAEYHSGKTEVVK